MPYPSSAFGMPARQRAFEFFEFVRRDVNLVVARAIVLLAGDLQRSQAGNIMSG